MQGNDTYKYFTGCFNEIEAKPTTPGLRISFECFVDYNIRHHKPNSTCVSQEIVLLNSLAGKRQLDLKYAYCFQDILSKVL